MTEQGSSTGRKDRGKRSPVAGAGAVADGVDVAANAVQAPGGRFSSDDVLRAEQLRELPA